LLSNSLVLEGGFAADIGLCGIVIQILVNLLLALGHGHEISLAVALVNLTGTHNIIDGVLNELVPMSEPASHSW